MALESKINEIDNRLKELGIEGLKYKVLSAISNFETTQNFINIQNHVDSGWLFRALGYYEYMLLAKEKFCKEANLKDTLLLTNINGVPIKNIVDDIKLRLIYLHNQKEITQLTAMKAKLTPFMNEESRFISALKEIDTMLKQ